MTAARVAHFDSSLNKRVSLGLARERVLVQVDELDGAERLENLANVRLGQRKVERPDVEAARRELVSSATCCTVSRRTNPAAWPGTPRALSRACRFFSASVY